MKHYYVLYYPVADTGALSSTVMVFEDSWNIAQAHQYLLSHFGHITIIQSWAEITALEFQMMLQYFEASARKVPARNTTGVKPKAPLLKFVRPPEAPPEDNK